MSVDWYRNTTWSDEIEAEFNRKLSRSKLKAQYLRIQASTLAKSHPEVSLKLLEQYFDQPDDVERAPAHVDQASALLTLGRDEEAIAAYEAALKREQEHPNVGTQAHLDLPFVIAVRQNEDHYDRALELLEAHAAKLLFPIDHFKSHAARALIAAARGNRDEAAEQRELALAAAERKHSGFDSHPKAGLVKDRYDDVIARLKELP